MQNIVNELINNSLKGVDTYRWRDATWLIFSEEHRWVIELTDGGTLWFNYKFFDNVLRYVSLDPNEGSKYITGWAESHFFRKNNGWKVFDSDAIHRENKAVTIVNRGVKKTEGRGKNHGDEFEWHTRAVVDNGVKKVRGLNSDGEWNIRNVMNNGIKETDTNLIDMDDGLPGKRYNLKCPANNTEIWMIVEDGIKNTYPDMIPGDYNWQDEFDGKKVILNGEKI
jgi:hypothetical protein